MTDRDALLAGIVSDPLEETRWLVLADWLQENDDPRRAELLRLHRKILATCCEPDAHPERAAWQARMVDLLVAGVQPCVPQETLTLPGGVPMTFSFIPPGAFLMGSEKGGDDERPVHCVELARGFFMGVYPVTQAQWRAVMSLVDNLNTPPDDQPVTEAHWRAFMSIDRSCFKGAGRPTSIFTGDPPAVVTQAQWKEVMSNDPSYFRGTERPVESVSWDDCREFCDKLSELTGRRTELPTEAEWEGACRAGTTTQYHFGDVLNTDLANYDGRDSWNGSPVGESRERTTDVSSFPANPWGLFDLHGNVYEWCESRYGPYPGGNMDCELSDERFPICRGGSWYNAPEYCRAAYRAWPDQEHVRDDCGFRVCLRLN